MKVELSAEAVERLEAQIAYLRDAQASQAADRLRKRVMDFLSNHLSTAPRTGRWLEERRPWETWIPRTRLVLWYRIEGKRILVVTVWHTSQDHASARP
jgi:plasmid stabilization system protein ParE